MRSKGTGKRIIQGAAALMLVVFLLAGLAYRPGQAQSEDPSSQPAQQPAIEAAALAPPPRAPIFRYPVVPGAVISGYFDHDSRSGQVMFYDGRRNLTQNYGFYFSCSTPNMYDFVGCEDPVTGESSCANSRELWYDGHKGIDYEYSQNWHTGATCDPNRFAGITMPVYAPAAGKVMFAGYDAGRPGNGWHIRIKHDLNGNGSYEDDNFRSNFLHFTAGALAVQTNQIVSEGQYLGLGGSTGYSSSPHLHFEVQRSSDNFSSTVWSVDPYGWGGPGIDPWPFQNIRLWNINMQYQVFIAPLFNLPAPVQGLALRNGGFEAGRADWVEAGIDIITHRSDANLPINPYAGDWLAWLGGRDSARDTIYQSFTVPGDLSNARLRYAVRMDTKETGGVFDQMYVRLRASNGDLIKQLDYLDNTFTPANQWILRDINLNELANRRGETLRISFEATTDKSLVTSFYLDEVSLEGQ